ncbi:23 kDa integral membrane protein [Aethina tumida]|uniref:23 kDa integral membrane protein n=1 Tax=Aethina tumida TaxID=116153 RepID=UPI0021498564|nr:23 kDa integral membrane protein [Aethina tumida]
MLISIILKPFLIVLNFIFMLIGLALVILDTIFMVNVNKYKEVVPEEPIFQHIPIVIIVVGSITLAASLLGCYGARKSNAFVLYTNGTILFVLVLAKIGLVVYIIVVFSNNLNEIEQTFHDIFEILYQSNNPIIKILLQRIKKEFNCGRTQFIYPSNVLYPSDVVIFEPACDEVFFSWLVRSIAIKIIILFVLIGLEFIGAVFSFCLARYT